LVISSVRAFAAHDLDEVGTGLDLLPRSLADLVRTVHLVAHRSDVPAVLSDRRAVRQDAGAWNDAPGPLS
jgi:hypothetical protein